MKIFSFLAGLLFIFLLSTYFYSHKTILVKPLIFDECDYIKASHKGIVANAIGENTLSFNEFLQMGYYKFYKDSASLANMAKNLPEWNENVFMLRHYHPPLPVYYWNLFLADDVFSQDYLLRISNLILLLLFIVVFLYTVLLYFKERIFSNSWAWAFIVAGALMSSNLFIHCFSSLNNHNFVAFFSLLFIFSLTNYLKNDSGKNLILFSLSISGLLLTLESSLFLLLGAIIAIFLLKLLKTFRRGKIMQIISIAFTATILLWPAFIIKGEFLKSIGMYFFRIFGKANIEYQEVSYFKGWMEIIVDSPFLFFTLAGTSIISIINYVKTKDKIILLPHLIGIIYAVIMTPFILNHTYILPAVTILCYAGTINMISFSFKYKPLVGMGVIIFGLFSFFFQNPLYTLFNPLNYFQARESFLNELNIVDSLGQDDNQVLAL